MFNTASAGQAQVLSVFSPGGALSCAGVNTTWNINHTWSVANLATYIPVRITHPVLVQSLGWVSGDVVSGNYDIGLYDAVGTRLASSGSIAVPGANTFVTFNMTDLRLEDRIVYLALALSSGTCRYYGYTVGELQEYRVAGFLEQASAVPLPAVATFAALTNNPPRPIVAMPARALSF